MIRDIFQSLEQMLLNLLSLLHADYIKQARGVCMSLSASVFVCVCVYVCSFQRKRGSGRERCRWGILTRLMVGKEPMSNIFIEKKSIPCWCVKI